MSTPNEDGKQPENTESPKQQGFSLLWSWLRLRQRREAKQIALGGGRHRAGRRRGDGGARHGEERQGRDASVAGRFCGPGGDRDHGRRLGDELRAQRWTKRPWERPLARLPS